jgi:hypothetical protein
MQWKGGGIWEWRKCRVEYVNISPASFCRLTQWVGWSYIIGRVRAVACDYRFINRYIADTMNLLAKYINFCHVRAKRAKNVPAFSFVTVQSLNLPDRQAISSNHHANNYRCQQMMNCQYITMSVNGAG